MKTNHTPGPWILEQDTVFIGETRKVQPVLYHGDSEGMANARLIASAPELLDALNAAYNALAWPDDEMTDEEEEELLESIRAALRKAKGE